MIVDDSGCYYVTSDPFIINVFRNPQNCAMNVIFWFVLCVIEIRLINVYMPFYLQWLMISYHYCNVNYRHRCEINSYCIYTSQAVYSY